MPLLSSPGGGPRQRPSPQPEAVGGRGLQHAPPRRGMPITARSHPGGRIPAAGAGPQVFRWSGSHRPSVHRNPSASASTKASGASGSGPGRRRHPPSYGGVGADRVDIAHRPAARSGAQSTASMQPQLCAQPSGNKLKTFGFRPVGCCRLADNHQLLIYPPTKLWSAKRVQGFPTLKVDLFKKFILLRPHQSFGPTVPPDHPPNCGAPNGSWWAPSSPGRPFLQQPKSRT